MPENIIEQLTATFIRFPGIGPKQARRFVYYLLRQDPNQLVKLANAIKSLRQEVSQCQYCWRYFTSQNSQAIKKVTCPICLDQSRDHSSIMVVEKDVDLDAVYKTDVYQGIFFVLGGLLPFLEKKPAQKIRLAELKQYLKLKKPTEVIIALSANPDGDHTAAYLKKELAETLSAIGAQISFLGRGFSTGTELEYSDRDTLNSALKNRS